MKKVLLTAYLMTIMTIGFSQSNKNFLDLRDNPLFFNPAFAGSYNLLDASISHDWRSNNINFNNTFSLISLSSPLKNEKWSIGGNLIHENTSVLYDFTSLDGIISYHKNLNKGKLSIGGAISIDRHHIDTRNFIIPQPIINDVVFTPQIGLGLLYQTKSWYISVSSPNILNVAWTYEDDNGTAYQGYTDNNFYISGGANLTVFNNKLQILPSATFHHINHNQLLGIVNRNFSLGTSIVLFERIWLTGGLDFLLNAQNTIMHTVLYNLADVGIGVNLKNGLRISGKVEWSIDEPTNLYYRDTNVGIVIGYRFSNKNDGLYLARRHFF